ncbi:hypothetical protein [Nocardioides salsibiostraticola]
MRIPLGSTPAALIGASLTLVLLAGCGDETDTATDPTATSTSASAESSPPATPAPEADEWRLVDIVAVTAAGGSTSTEVTPVGDPDDLSTFTDQFASEALAAEVAGAVEAADPRPGHLVAAAVVALGCDVPTEVTYVDGMIRAVKVPKPLPECFAPVTSVAIVEVPAAE